ncbi:hypothetical protein PFISCL1PPCAC_7410, partial [Pristionchus fissidentatus]
THNWLKRYEQILREADSQGNLWKPSGSCVLVPMKMTTGDLVPTISNTPPSPATFQQGLCRGGCFIDPISRSRRCCKPT